MNRKNPFAGRIDENEPAIVAALKARGVSVQRLKDVGKGCPDLLCGYNGLTVLIEVKRADATDYRLAVGHAIERAMQRRGWALKALAEAVGRDARQVARWQNGDERPHFDALLAIDDALFHNALVIAFAELGTGVEIDTVIHVPRRTA